MAFGFLKKIKDGLVKTVEAITTPLTKIFRLGRKVDDEFLNELEEALILADVGPRLAKEIVDDVKQRYMAKEIDKPSEIVAFMKNRLVGELNSTNFKPLVKAESGPTLILLVGVNGTGKTTTAAKLAKHYKDQGFSVLLGAADTFRAAAGEQLDLWANRVGVEIVRQPDGTDPAAVVYNACEAAKNKDIDYIIVDTAGRMHTKSNLMQQLDKIRRVAAKRIPGSPHEVLLVLDSTTGQNALNQAKVFSEGVGLTGLILTKLDGTARGGIVLAIHRQVQLPIRFIGTGEKADDFAPFDPVAFCNAMFDAVDATDQTEIKE